MLSLEQVRALGQVLDTTFCRSSTTDSATSSFKSKLSGNMLTVTYATICKFASERDQLEQANRFDDESAKRCSANQTSWTSAARRATSIAPILLPSRLFVVNFPYGSPVIDDKNL